jgi:hypothetical protein
MPDSHPSREEQWPAARPIALPLKTTHSQDCDPLQVIDSTELAKRLNVPESWVRSRTNWRRTSDPIPHYKLGRYIRFNWGSRELADWLNRQLVSANRAGSKI